MNGILFQIGQSKIDRLREEVVGLEAHCRYELMPSVADMDLSDPYVFGPPGSGSRSISQRYGSGSGSFYHQAKTVRNNFIPTVL
jgi:hypothetical protein